jgi:hypothetical protein
MSIKRLNLFVILALFLAGCGSVPATDWCYTFSFAGGRPSGWTGFATDSVGGLPTGTEFYAEFTRSSFTPQYIQFFFNNSGAEDTVFVDGSGWGASAMQNVTVPTGVSSGYISAGSAGTNGALIADGVASTIRITGVRFYGNGTNPFPSNECTPSATATPSATSAPSASATPVGLTLDTNSLFSQTNGWISVFVPIFALLVGAPLAIAIVVFVGRSIIQALRGGR